MDQKTNVSDSHAAGQLRTRRGDASWARALGARLGAEVGESQEWIGALLEVDFGKELFPGDREVLDWMSSRPAAMKAIGEIGSRCGGAALAKWVGAPDGSDGSKQVEKALSPAWKSLANYALQHMRARQASLERALLSSLAKKHGLRAVRFVNS